MGIFFAACTCMKRYMYYNAKPCHKTGGALHYAKVTSQRSVGIPEENGTTFSDKIGPTNRNGSCHFKFCYRIP